MQGHIGSYTWDKRTRALTKDGAKVAITETEQQILEYLFDKAGQWVSASELTKAVWKTTTVSSHTLATHVSNLRKKLGDPGLILGSKHGYRLGGAQDVADSLPDPELVLQYDNAPYSVESATEDDVRWAARLAQRVYLGIDVIPEDTMVAWYRHNRNGFFVVKNCRGAAVGNLDVLAFRPATLEAFLAGRTIERHITPDGLYGAEESEQIDALYVESFVCVLDPEAGRLQSNALGVGQVLKELPELLHRICKPRARQAIYAIAASDPGRKLLKKLDFEIVSAASAREDRHDLFGCQVQRVVRSLTKLFQADRLRPSIRTLIEALDHEEERGL